MKSESKIIMKFHNCILFGTASIPRLGFHFMQCSNNKWGVSHRRFLCCTIAVVQRVFIRSKGILLSFFQGLSKDCLKQGILCKKPVPTEILVSNRFQSQCRVCYSTPALTRKLPHCLHMKMEISYSVVHELRGIHRRSLYIQYF